MGQCCVASANLFVKPCDRMSVASILFGLCEHNVFGASAPCVCVVESKTSPSFVSSQVDMLDIVNPRSKRTGNENDLRALLGSLTYLFFASFR